MNKREFKRLSRLADTQGIARTAEAEGVSYSTLRSRLMMAGYVPQHRGRPTGKHKGAVRETASDVRRPEVKRMLRKGMTARRIAEEMGLCERTIRADMAKIKELKKQ